MNPRMIDAIKSLKPSLLVTANNHIVDYGLKGLSDTEKILTDNSVAYIGSGATAIESVFSFELGKQKIAIVNFAEKEFCEIDNKSYISLYDDSSAGIIRRAKNENDIVIVIYHGGVEHLIAPGEYLVSRTHAMVDYGADIIICQHNHIVGLKEVYKDATIIYGQGNFIADYNYSNIDYGILVNIVFGEENIEEIDIIPIKKSGNKVSLISGKEKEEFKDSYNKRNINDLKASYDEYVREDIYRRLQILSAMPNLLRKIDNHTNHYLIKRMYKERDLLTILNLLRCDVHRFGMIEGIKQIID